MSYVEEMVQCPYDTHHLIRKSRFITHLCKCRKQHGGSNFCVCPFNATHNILSPELQYHINNCPDRKKLDSHLYVVGDQFERNKLIDVAVSSRENWDDEPAVNESYLDVKDNLISKRPLLRLPAGKSKSLRKEFFANEVQRFEKLSLGEEIDCSTKKSTPELTKFTSSGTGLGRGTAHNKTDISKRKETDFPSQRNQIDDDDDDDEDSENFSAIVLNRGRGRAIRPSSDQKV